MFLGRFQPFHKGHLHDVLLAAKEFDEILIVIGSSQYSGTEDNPFSAKQRREMIESVLKGKLDNYAIYELEDIHEHPKYVKHMKSKIPDFVCVITGNPFTKKLFSEAGYEVRDMALLDNISGTHIRELMKEKGDWQKLVPEEIAEYIEKNVISKNIK